MEILNPALVINHWKIGMGITRFNPVSNSFARSRKLLESYGIDVVLDVGGNIGQFVQQMRTEFGYSGSIVLDPQLLQETHKRITHYTLIF